MLIKFLVCVSLCFLKREYQNKDYQDMNRNIEEKKRSW